MNTQTLNRMIKASYSAPNGVQLRKACYAVMAANSRRASVGAMSVEDLAQLPKEEQGEIKVEIVKEALIESSAESQAKLSSVGLKDVTKFVQSNHITAEKVLSTVKETDPELQQAIKSEIHTAKDGIALASAVVKARSFQEILSFLDAPLDWVQIKYENINWFKYDVICHCIYTFLAILVVSGPAIGLGIGGSILAALAGVGIDIGLAALIYYLFGNIIDWVNKWQARLQMWITLFPLRLISFILKSFGWVLDQFTSGIQSALSFFNKQAKIAMQSPEFRRAYYSI